MIKVTPGRQNAYYGCHDDESAKEKQILKPKVKSKNVEKKPSVNEA